jgi:alpha-L-fucosidase 2
MIHIIKNGGTIAALLFLLFKGHMSKAQDMDLWYEKPAMRWEEMLPLGNGLIGMMPDGGVKDEKIVLNEISMWSGGKEDPNNCNAYRSLPAILDFLQKGQNDLAEGLVNRNFVTNGKDVSSVYRIPCIPCICQKEQKPYSLIID